MLSVNQLMENKKEPDISNGRRSAFYESTNLIAYEKSLNLDYNEYQLKNFINFRTSGEGFKEAVKGGLEKIWKFIQGIFNAILKGLDNFWQTIKKIFSRKKKKDEPKEKMNDELNATIKEKERLAKELERTKEQLRQAQQSNKANANLKNQNAEKIAELERLQSRNEKKISILKNKINKKDRELDKAKQDRKLEEEVSSNIRKAYNNYRDKTEEKYGEKDIKNFLYNMRDIGNSISDTTGFLINTVRYLELVDGDHSKDVHETMEAFNSEMLEIQKRLDDINVDKVKEILSKGFYLTQEELEYGANLPRDAFSQPYDTLRKSQSRLTSTRKKMEKEISQIMSSDSNEQKVKVEALQSIAEGLKQAKVQYDKYKRHLVSFAIAIEPILDEKAKGYFRGIR